jgi:hypothetical protein
MKELFKEQVRRIFNTEVDDEPLEAIETETVDAVEIVVTELENLVEKKKIKSLF